MLIKVWILTAFFIGGSGTLDTQQYNFKTRAECVEASKFYSNQTNSSRYQKPTCYPSYIQVK